MKRDALKVGISGVRGVVGDSFTPQLAAAFSQAFGVFVGRGPVVVGRDTRASGPMIQAAVVAGLQSVGCQPLLAGVAPTPSVLVLTRDRGARGGIAITASHNAAPWNALKFVNRQGLFLSPVQADELFDIYHQGDFPVVRETEIPRTARIEDPVRGHFERIARYVDVARIRARRFRVAVDCCNGVGALYSAPFLREWLGCEVTAIFDRVTGAFERGPEPVPEHLAALGRAVVAGGCAIGFGQDPDGDRLAIVDEQGRPIGEDFTVAFAARQVLTAHGAGPVVLNLSTSKSVEQVARAAGARVSRSRIGEIYVVERMLETHAVAGGEGNGGFILPAVHPCRDSFTAMAVVLEMLATDDRAVSAWHASMPRYAMRKDKVPVEAAAAPGILRRVRRAYERWPLNLADGVYVDMGEQWCHVRRSNTEPVIRITTEAPTAEAAAALVAEVRALIGQG